MSGGAEEKVTGHFATAEEGEEVVQPGDDGRQHVERGQVDKEHDGVVNDGRDAAQDGFGGCGTEVVAGSDAGGADALLCVCESSAAGRQGGVRGDVRAGPFAGSHADRDECDARAQCVAGRFGGTDSRDQDSDELFISRLAQPHAGHE